MESEGTLNLLQPELLSAEQLVEHLQSRAIPVSVDLGKEKLLEMYYRICLPLPQRQYKKNRRGKLLTEKQKEQQLEKPSTSRKNDGMQVEKDTVPSSNCESSSSKLEVPLTNRLKPPPAAVENKVIRLVTNQKISKVENGSTLDHIVIKRRPSSTEKPLNDETCKEDKTIPAAVTKNSIPQRIKLKRPVITSEDSSPPSEQPQPKKERKRISWP